MKLSFGHWVCVSLTIALGALSSTALAEDRGPLANDVEVSVGAFLVTNSTRVRLDGQNNVTGTDVDWEHDLGLEDANRVRVDGFWRFAKRHKVRFMYFENDRSATRSLTRDIVFDGTTYPVNASVTAEFETKITELAYEYAFLQTDNLELAGAFGIHNVKITAGLSGSISTTGGAGAAAQTKVEESTNGPLPVLGLHVLWHLGGDFYFDGLGQFFYANIDNFNGRLSDYKLVVTWYPIRNAGIGLGFDKFVTRVDVDKRDFTGTLRLSYGGPMAFLTLSF